MTHRKVLAALATAALTATVSACAAGAAATRPSPSHSSSRPKANASAQTRLRIMPLGDSITYGMRSPGGYRTDLWQLLRADGVDAEMVGSQYSGPAELGSKNHEGHGGWEIAQISAQVQGWLAEYRPNVVLLHIGTNDLLHHKAAGAPGRLLTLLNRIKATVPTADIYVATLVPLGGKGMAAPVRSYNSALVNIVGSAAAADPHIHLVRMQPTVTVRDLSIDLIHPSAPGYSKMAECWFAALRGRTMTRWEAENPRVTQVVNGRRMTSLSASGRGKVGFLITPASRLVFHVNVPAPGRYRLFIRAANGMKTPCAQALVVDGRPWGTVSYANYGFDHWTMNGVDVDLAAGPDTVELDHDLCNAEIDSIDLMPTV